MSDAHGSETRRALKSKPLIVQPIWDRLDHAVIVTDGNLTAPGPTIRYVNRAFTRLTGYRADEVIGRSPRLLQCPHTDLGKASTIRRDLHERDFARATLVNRRKDGSEYLCTLIITPLIGAAGEPGHFICVAEALKDDGSAFSLRQVSVELEQALTLIDDLERCRNEANDLIAQQRGELEALADRHRATCARLEAVQERLTLRESALERSDQECVRHVSELYASTEELRAMEEELRVALEQMEEANAQLARSNEELRHLQASDADKLQLLASASHDLRQPVMSMGLFLDVLRHRIGEAERPILGGLLAAHVSIRTLLDGMLDTARLDAGALEPTIEPVPMSVILEVLYGEFMLQAEMRGLRFRVMPCTATVFSDAQLLERILRNLVANALKYTSAGGILLGCRQCRDAEGGKQLRIEVWDTGSGIAEHNLTLIFEEFRQLDNRDRDHKSGVGLGLAIVSRLARRLNHEVSVRSWPGRGSVFSVTVPLVPKHSTGREGSRARSVG